MQKRELCLFYAELVYNGYWFSKKRLNLQKIVDKKRNQVNGEVVLKFIKAILLLFQEDQKTMLIRSRKFLLKKIKHLRNPKLRNL